MRHTQKLTRFLLYLAVVILINVAATTLFFRIDLTHNNLYSLSRASRNAVENLTEPLTIKVFFTRNLPAPYNGIERYLHDLLAEYAIHGGDRFNYSFYDVSPTEGATTDETMKNREVAQSYGIQPVQIQNIEQDEVKFQKAYMGMVFIHGDQLEKLPAVTSTDGLEYKITTTIRKLVNTVSALAGLEEPIHVKLFLSDSLQAVAPALNMNGLAQVPDQIRDLVTDLNRQFYGKLTFERVDPGKDEAARQEAIANNMVTLNWNDFQDRRSGKTVPAGSGTAGILISHGDKSQEIPLIKAETVPLFGTQYRLADIAELKETIPEVANSVLDINRKIGYLADHGTPSLMSFGMMQQQSQGDTLNNFNSLVSDTYSISSISIAENGIPEGLETLVIAGPTEPFSDYELYQIDQFLMRGGSLALFLDPFNEIMPQRQQQFQQFNQGPAYIPLNTGLDKLLNHYGVSVKKAYALDEQCYKQRLPQAYGGGENAIYFAPEISQNNINRKLEPLENIKQLVTLKAAPLETKDDTLKQSGITATTLFTTTDQAWEMTGQINLNPMMIKPPAEDKREQIKLALLLEGTFPSYFADKPVPAKPQPEGQEAEQKKAEKPAGIMDEVQDQGRTLKKSRGGKILLVGTSDMLKDNMLDKEGTSPNATFVLNMLDTLSGREADAVLRGKIQRFNPLEKTTAGTKTTVKVMGIVGLPALIALFGIFMWIRRMRRMRFIQTLYRANRRTT